MEKEKEKSKIKSSKYLKLFNQDCIKGLKEHISDKSVDLIFTDPPYGIQGDKLDKHYKRDENHVIQGYKEVSLEDYPIFTTNWINECERVLKPGGTIYIVSGYTNLFHILKSLRGTKLVEINHLIAQYSFGVYTTKKYVSSHYHILFWAKKGKRTFNTFCRFDNTRDSYNDRLSVQTLKRRYNKGETKNKNQLPKEFVEKYILYSSNQGDTVLDPFAGSFSTGFASIENSRHFIGFESNPLSFKYFSEKLMEAANET